MTLRVLQLQDGLAIEKIVAGRESIEAHEVLPQESYFCVVKLSVKRRNRIRTDIAAKPGNRAGS